MLVEVKVVAESSNEHFQHSLPPSPEVPILRILVVDDYPDSADSLAEVLKCLGHNVHVSYDGESALATAVLFRPHICLLDLAMPGMDGLELAALLKAGAGISPLLLIATTAFGDWETKTHTALAGFHYHLTKPVDLAALVEAITKLGKLLEGFSRKKEPSEESLLD